MPMPQSAGHACVLQARVSAECGHAVPPFEGSTVARLRRCEPVPHDLVHVDQVSKVPTTQLEAQAKVLHTCVSALCAHATPPYKGGVVTRLRFCEP